MAKSQAHRGPDHMGYATFQNAAFAHQRLSIIDLNERSNQPMTKGSLTIVFNGEIYNFRDIKRQLQSSVTFKTTSDTEVVLEAWRKWGPRSLNELRGMYAFAIFDSTTGETFIARDPFGIKPIFYCPLPNGGLAFSSELKALETIDHLPLTLNYEAVAASLLYVWLPEDLCIWNEVHKLAPGHYLHVNVDGAFRSLRYWEPLDLVSNPPSVVENTAAIDSLEQCLLDSVNSHIVADVPVNSFLSGGLDSSLIVAMARRELGSLDCYTIKFTEDAKKQEAMPDDAYYAGIVARALGVRLHTIEAKPDMVQLLPQIVHHLDEPIGDSAAINTFLMCAAAHRNGVKVLLSGMGADELFGGYRKHHANQLAAKYRRIPSVVRSKIISPVVSHLPVASPKRGFRLARWAKRFLEFADLPTADAFLGSYTYYTPQSLDELTRPMATELSTRIVCRHHSIFNSAGSRSLLDKMCFADSQLFMTSLNLTYTDRASMAASTEVRVPFIDKNVAQLAFSIDSRLKIRGKKAKYVLKKVAERWLPHQVVHRQKSSFTMPLRAWIKGDLKDIVDDYVLSSGGLAGRGLLDTAILRRIVEEDRRGQRDNAQRLWHLMTLEQWLRNKKL